MGWFPSFFAHLSYYTSPKNAEDFYRRMRGKYIRVVSDGTNYSILHLNEKTLHDVDGNKWNDVNIESTMELMPNEPYICMVASIEFPDEIRPTFIVNPVMRVSWGIVNDPSMKDLCLRSGLFTEQQSRLNNNQFNTRFLAEKVQSIAPIDFQNYESYIHGIAVNLVQHLLNGRVTSKEVTEWLLTPTLVEAERDNILYEIDEFIAGVPKTEEQGIDTLYDQFPLLCQLIREQKADYNGCWPIEAQALFVHNLLREYDDAVMDGELEDVSADWFEMYYQMEAVLALR